MSSLSGKSRVQEILIFVLTFHILMTKEIVSLFAPREWLLEGPISPDQCYGSGLINQTQLLYPATAGSYTGYYSMDATSKNGPLQAAADSKLPPVSLNRHAHFGGFVKAFARRLTKQSGACVDNLPPGGDKISSLLNLSEHSLAALPMEFYPPTDLIENSNLLTCVATQHFHAKTNLPIYPFNS